jgi:DNA topoisomerase-3
MVKAMSKALIIAEKPSVARDIVQAIGGFSPLAETPKGVQAWESQSYICTHALGHLLELYAPEDYNPKHKQWTTSDLPIVPAGFRTKPKQVTALILRTLKQLIARPDVTEIINACDAAREGELIFREIVDHSLSPKKISRVWLRSLTPDAIRAAVTNRKPGTEFSGLANAAYGRSQADWLIGMNLSRAATLKLSRASEGGVWSIGRVQTPTLAMLVEREFQILSHKNEPYQQILATFDAGDHQYDGTWYREPQPSSSPADLVSDAKLDRITDPAETQNILASLKAGLPAIATEVRKSREQKAPELFSLTALQRHMASKHRWSAKKTLEVAQKCYEQYKIITYPRTESSALPSDYQEKVNQIFDQLKNIKPYDQYAATLEQRDQWQNVHTVFNDSLVSDHFAIIPTGVFPAKLPVDEGLLFDAVIRQLLAALMPPAIIANVKRTTIVGVHHFRSGPDDVVEYAGWRAAAILDDSKEKAKTLHLNPLKSPAAVTLLKTSLRDAHTKPPPRISEAQLLSLMEHAGRQIQDREAAKVLKDAGGLGTAATRAEIIENLKHKEFIHEDLQPTVKGLHLIRFLKLARVEHLTSPQLTADLEALLFKVEKLASTREAFVAEIINTVHESLNSMKNFDLDRAFDHAPSLGACPRCQSSVHERMWNYSCRSNQSESKSCGFTLPKDCDGRWLDPKTVERLLSSNGVPLKIEGFPDHQKTLTSKRQLQILNGCLEIRSEAGLEIAPGMHTNTEKTSTKRRVTWGPCPIHKGDPCLIVETKKAFICETRLRTMRELGPEGNHHGFYLPKSICEQRLKFEDINSFIKDGKTRVIAGFKSKGGKIFDASIVRNTSGSWAMDFRSKPIQSHN